MDFPDEEYRDHQLSHPVSLACLLRRHPVILNVSMFKYLDLSTVD